MTPMRALVILVLVLAAAWGGFHLQSRYPQHLPWTPLVLGAPIGWSTGLKLRALENDPALCRRLLADAGVMVESVPDRTTGDSCGFRDAVRLADPGVPLLPGPVVLTCPMAAALTIWTREVVKPAVQAQLGGPATAIVHYGSYNCRDIDGSGRRSQHATANAIDIAGIRTASRRAVVQRDWAAADEAGAVLRDVHDGACKLFAVTLGPDYNAAHADHLHLDLGSGMACR